VETFAEATTSESSESFHQRIFSTFTVLKLNHIQFVYVPACCTSELQPLDADGGQNFRLKQLLKHEFSMWYSNVVMKKNRQ
jgi:hypothetical protein